MYSTCFLVKEILSRSMQSTVASLYNHPEPLIVDDGHVLGKGDCLKFNIHFEGPIQTPLQKHSLWSTALPLPSSNQNKNHFAKEMLQVFIISIHISISIPMKMVIILFLGCCLKHCFMYLKECCCQNIILFVYVNWYVNILQIRFNDMVGWY